MESIVGVATSPGLRDSSTARLLILFKRLRDILFHAHTVRVHDTHTYRRQNVSGERLRAPIDHDEVIHHVVFAASANWNRFRQRRHGDPE